MSDTKNTSGRKPLSTSKKSGTVEQSFSHGKTRKVEVQRRSPRVAKPGAKAGGEKGDSSAKGPSKAAEIARKLGITEQELRARQAALLKRRESEQQREV